MAEGIIKRWFSDKGYGFITPDDNSTDVKFCADNLRDANPMQIAEGMRVRYDLRRKADRPTTFQFWLLDIHATAPIAQREQVAESATNSGYRFLNPYNFVRLLDEPRPTNHVLGSIPPPPHDRYTGLSGRISCKLEAVTPLFVSDSHGTSKEAVKDGKDHYTYRFFEYDGQPAIPASSLRGMLRNVFEAVTISCLPVFAGDRKLEYRQATQYALKLKAGIVRSLPSDEQPGTISLCRTAKIGAYYSGQKEERNSLSGKKWKCGDHVWARVTKGRTARVWQLANSQDGIRETTEKSEIVQGYLKITGENIEKKVNEYLFIDPDTHGGLGTVSFGKEVMGEYNTILEGQISEERIMMFQHRKLTVGDLVWVEDNGANAIRIAHVRIPRVQYDKRIQDLISNRPDLKHCENIQSLCPACRTFGWVHSNPEKNTDYTAYAGRVRFSHACLEHDAGRYDDILLTILSAPKPTTTQFYLLNSKGEPDAQVNYNKSGASLRGRKFYRHFGNWFNMTETEQRLFEQEYRQAVKPGEDGRSDQNRTVKGAFKPGAKFSIELEFEDLQPLELGALLYALGLEDGLHHRLGYAKPLGFGSIKLTIDSLMVLHWEERFISLNADAGWKPKTEKIASLVNDFLDYMRQYYGQIYGSVLHDLRSILREPPDLPVHYPRPDDTPNPEGKQFEWFVGNKKRVEKMGKGDLPDPVVLPLAIEDVEGFPLISKEGH